MLEPKREFTWSPACPTPIFSHAVGEQQPAGMAAGLGGRAHLSCVLATHVEVADPVDGLDLSWLSGGGRIVKGRRRPAAGGAVGKEKKNGKHHIN